MHIDIIFTGSIDQISEIYMDTVETVNEWSRTNEVDVNMGWANDVLTITLPDRLDYGLWVSTYLGPYTLDCGGWESF